MLDCQIGGAVRVEAHQGTRSDFLDRHRIEAHEVAWAGPKALRKFCKGLLARIADTRTLRVAFDHLSQYGGEGPGPDDLCCRDLSRSEMWELLRLLSNQIKSGTYQHGPVRTVQVPKGTGRGTRPITLENLKDRIASRAVVEIIQPLFNPIMDPHSFCRFASGRFRALARVEFLLRDTQRSVWIAEDVENAFGQVPHGRLLDIVRVRLPEPNLVELIHRIITNESDKGLRQGACVSPLLANLYFDHFLDRKWRRRHPTIPLLRFMDDLLIMCKKDEDSEAIYAELKQILQDAAMPLKGNPENSIHRLDQGARIPWLGFSVSPKEDCLEYRLPRDKQGNLAFYRLSEKLLLAHALPDSPLRAIRAINGIAYQAGPAFAYEDHRHVHRHIAAISREAGFEEIPGLPEFTDRWRSAFNRWGSLRERLTTLVWKTNEPTGQPRKRRQPKGLREVIYDALVPPW